MKGILIDPAEKSVAEAEYSTDLDSIHKLLRCKTVDIVPLSKPLYMVVDDEGLYVENQSFFAVNSLVFAGRTLIVVLDQVGEFAGIGGLEVDTVFNDITWLKLTQEEIAEMRKVIILPTPREEEPPNKEN